MPVNMSLDVALMVCQEMQTNGAIQDLGSLALTSRFWNSVATPSLYRVIEVSTYGHEKALAAKLLESVRHLRAANLKHAWYIAVSMPAADEIGFTPSVWKIVLQNVVALIPSCSALRSFDWNVAAPMPQGLINGLEQRQLPITSKLRLSGDLSMAIRPTFRLAISELRELTLTNCDNYEFLFGALNTGENQLGKLRVQTRSISPALEVFLSTTCSLTVLELQCNNIIEKEEVITECIRNNGDNLQSIKLCIDPAQLACAPSVANGQIQTRLRDHKFRGCTVAMLGQINQFCPNLKQLYVDVALDSLAEHSCMPEILSRTASLSQLTVRTEYVDAQLSFRHLVVQHRHATMHELSARVWSPTLKTFDHIVVEDKYVQRTNPSTLRAELLPSTLTHHHITKANDQFVVNELVFPAQEEKLQRYMKLTGKRIAMPSIDELKERDELEKELEKEVVEMGTRALEALEEKMD